MQASLLLPTQMQPQLLVQLLLPLQLAVQAGNLVHPPADLTLTLAVARRRHRRQPGEYHALSYRARQLRLPRSVRLLLPLVRICMASLLSPLLLEAQVCVQSHSVAPPAFLLWLTSANRAQQRCSSSLTPASLR